MSRLDHYGIDSALYDTAILVAASGTPDAGASGGSAATLLDDATHSKVRLSGAATFVDIRFMDVMAVAAALRYHQAKLAKPGKHYRVKVVTENFDLVKEASQDGRDGYEWSMITWFEQQGYILDWCWESSVAANRKAEADAARAAQTAVREATEWRF